MIHWTERYLGGHISFYIFSWRIVIFGFNAMHVAINISTRKFGYICFHPPMRCFGRWWPWYFYISPNATPWASTFAIGPEIGRVEGEMSKLRRVRFGHNFDCDHHYDEMMEIKDRMDKKRAAEIRERFADY